MADKKKTVYRDSEDGQFIKKDYADNAKPGNAALCSAGLP